MSTTSSDHSPASSSKSTERTKLVGIGAIVAGACFVAGSMLPWVTIRIGPFTSSLSGTEGGLDGIIILILGVFLVAAGGAMLVGVTWKVSPVLLGVDAGVVTLIVLLNLPNIGDAIRLARGESTPDIPVLAYHGVGLWVIGVGVVLAIFTGTGARRNRVSDADRFALEYLASRDGVSPTFQQAPSRFGLGGSNATVTPTHQIPAGGAELRILPSEDLINFKPLPAGTRVVVLDRQPERGWTMIETEGGDKGWIGTELEPL